MYSYVCVPSLLCAELAWAELVMCRGGYVPSLLCAELTRHLLQRLYTYIKVSVYCLSPCVIDNSLQRSSSIYMSKECLNNRAETIQSPHDTIS